MPKKKGPQKGKWKSRITGRYVSSHYGKRNPKRAYRVDLPPDAPEQNDTEAPPKEDAM